jgi:hypothetical protein
MKGEKNNAMDKINKNFNHSYSDIWLVKSKMLFTNFNVMKLFTVTSRLIFDFKMKGEMVNVTKIL